MNVRCAYYRVKSWRHRASITLQNSIEANQALTYGLTSILYYLVFRLLCAQKGKASNVLTLCGSAVVKIEVDDVREGLGIHGSGGDHLREQARCDLTWGMGAPDCEELLEEVVAVLVVIVSCEETHNRVRETANGELWGRR